MDGVIRALPRETEKNDKRGRSRARLLEAALQVMSERGITATSVSEIAAAADMANGTFYLHFRNKTQVVAAVCSAVTLAMHREMDDRRLAISDGAERIAFGTQQFVEIAAEQPAWGRLLLSAFTEFDAIKEDLARYMRLDVKLGVRQGRFPERCNEFVIDCHLAVLRTAIAARLGGAKRDVGARAAEYQLRILGMTSEEARRVRLAGEARVGLGRRKRAAAGAARGKAPR